MHNLCRIRDKAGNMLRKTVNGKTTTFAFDDANQLVSSTTDGVTTRYAYDAAGRMVREGSKTYRYGYLDKVMSVTDGDTTRTYTYHADGQLASANYGDTSESFAWDGLALIQRGDEQFINEPHVGGGNPVASSKGTSYFNDALGTTVGSWEGRASSRPESGLKYSAAALTAFGENLSVDSPTPTQNSNFFTGKPFAEGLGHAFLMRNYRAGLAKWQTADPMGYPDGWNQLAYCGNGVTSAVDLWGCEAVAYFNLYERYIETLVSLNSVDALDTETSKTMSQAKLRVCRPVPMDDRSIEVLDYDWRKVKPEDKRVRNGVVEYLYERCVDTWDYEVFTMQVQASKELNVEYWESTASGGGVVGIAIPALGIATTIAGAIESAVKKVLTLKLGENEWIPVGVMFTRKRENGEFVITHHRKAEYRE